MTLFGNITFIDICKDHKDEFVFDLIREGFEFNGRCSSEVVERGGNRREGIYLWAPSLE